MTAQIIEISGEKLAVLPVADYQKLLAIAEDKADAESAAQAERRRDEGEEYLPAELVDRILNGENPLKVWREYRGMTQEALAEKVGRRKAMISKLETGRNAGGVDLWSALAKTLSVTIDDIKFDAQSAT